MGLPLPAWLQEAAWVLTEARGGEASCLRLLGKPKMAGVQYSWPEGQHLELLLVLTWELMLPSVPSAPLQGPSWV